MGKHEGGIWSALAWLVFPLVPALLGSTYQQTFNRLLVGEGPDPRQWGVLTWVLLAGPLAGYGFLAGATLDLPDDSSRRGWRGWLARRSVWVGVGPWAGFLFCSALFYTLVFADTSMAWAFPAGRGWVDRSISGWQQTSTGRLLGGTLAIVVVGTLAFGWLLVAMAALLRARRTGRCRRAIGRGLAAALGFVGSLFGSFWAITEVWRAYFFDPRVVPIVVAATSLALTAGCSGTVTYGEVRRRELFQAILMAWLLGLALAWRWWSRPRK
jgi:hypothetical protein